MALLRVELLAYDTAARLETGDRTLILEGGDHLLVDLARVGDRVLIELTSAPAAFRDRALGAELDPACSVAAPALRSRRAGSYTVEADGTESYERPAPAKPRAKWHP